MSRLGRRKKRSTSRRIASDRNAEKAAPQFAIERAPIASTAPIDFSSRRTPYRTVPYAPGLRLVLPFYSIRRVEQRVASDDQPDKIIRVRVRVRPIDSGSSRGQSQFVAILFFLLFLRRPRFSSLLLFRIRNDATIDDKDSIFKIKLSSM